MFAKSQLHRQPESIVDQSGPVKHNSRGFTIPLLWGYAFSWLVIRVTRTALSATISAQFVLTGDHREQKTNMSF